ncbi:hypothetical protein NUACC26_041850 [Scytonema sp. NUACC26]
MQAIPMGVREQLAYRSIDRVAAVQIVFTLKV